MHERRIEIRWSDLDAYAHVYHPVYLTYMEAARDQWLGRVLELRGRIWDYVVARVTIDYRGALALADGAAVVRCRLQRIGRSSLTTREQVLAPDGRVAAEAEVVIVAWDATTGGSRPLEQVERAALEARARTRRRLSLYGQRYDPPLPTARCRRTGRPAPKRPSTAGQPQTGPADPPVAHPASPAPGPSPGCGTRWAAHSSVCTPCTVGCARSQPGGGPA